MQENKANFDGEEAAKIKETGKISESEIQQNENDAAEFEKFGLACRGEEFGVFGISAWLAGENPKRKINLK